MEALYFVSFDPFFSFVCLSRLEQTYSLKKYSTQTEEMLLKTKPVRRTKFS